MLQKLDGWANEEFAGKGIRWPGLFIISGHRSREMQTFENPDAPNSLHLRCPSLAADLRVGGTPASLTADPIWNWLGTRWRLMGGRWGGQFTVRDENHFDLGVTSPPHPELPL
jgi:hypothetical protein